MSQKLGSVSINITEVTIVSGKKKYINLKINENIIKIPVDEEVFAHWQDQFPRKTPTSLQAKRFATIMNILRAAYLKGLEDGANQR